MQASHVRVKMVTCLVHPSCLQVLETLENFGGYFQGIVCNLLGISPASDYWIHSIIRRRGNIQKITHYTQNMAKVWNQEFSR